MKHLFDTNIASTDTQCVVRTYASSIKLGSAYYEHHVAKALRSRFTVDLWAADPLHPAVLKYKKLRYIYQTLTQKKNAEFLVTGMELFSCGLNVRRFKKKILILYHFGLDDTERKWVQYLINRNVLKNINQFDRIVVIADFWRDFLSHYVDSRKIRVIRCGYPLNFAATAIQNLDVNTFKSQLGIPLDKSVIYAGAADHRKGVVKVLNKLDKKKFFIYTTGRKNLNIPVSHFNLGFYDYLRLLSVSDTAIFLPDFLEGWTRCAHEALLCGTPIIGLNSGGLGELIRSTGQLQYREGDDLESLIEKTRNERVHLIEKAKPFLENNNDEHFTDAWVQTLLEL